MNAPPLQGGSLALGKPPLRCCRAPSVKCQRVLLLWREDAPYQGNPRFAGVRHRQLNASAPTLRWQEDPLDDDDDEDDDDDDDNDG